MTLRMHYTERSGFFPCEATGDCPKGTHFAGSIGSVVASYRVTVKETSKAYKRKEITIRERAAQFDAAAKTMQDELAEVYERASKLSKEVVPRDRSPEHAKYFAQTDLKHFGSPDLPGSKFIDSSLKKVEDVVEITARQRGHLQEDDKDKFIKLGADPSAFNPNFRYLYVETPGTVGIKNTSTLPDNELVEVVRTKDGVPCSVVASVKEQEKTNYGVVILAKDKDTGKDLLITTFPGMVTKSLKNDELDSLEGQTITVAKARKIMGGDFWANTKLI